MVRRTGIVNKVGGPMGPMGVLELAGEARRRHDIAGAADAGAAALAMGDQHRLAKARGDRRGALAAAKSQGQFCDAGLTYLVAITALCGPASGTTRQSEKPASRIQPMQSEPVKSNPPLVSISMLMLISRPGRWVLRSSSINSS